MEIRWLGLRDEEGREWRRSLTGWAEELGFLDMNVVVTLASGCLKRAVYCSTIGDEYPGDHSFRAFANFGAESGVPEVFLFFDAETVESIKWLFIHELIHVALRLVPILHNYVLWKRDEWLGSLGITPEQWVSDKALQLRDDLHENEPEERICNAVATRYMGGRDYSRKWWRRHRAKLGLDNGIPVGIPL